MAKRTKKISVNLTEEQYKIIEWIAKRTRRTISDVASLILVDNSRELFREMQPKGEFITPKFIPSKGTSIFSDEED